MSALRLAACKRKEDDQVKLLPDAKPLKKPRLVFTDIQRRTLHAIFKETKRPSKEMQTTIAQQLGLEVSTVANFFMNARRRSLDKWQDDKGDLDGLMTPSPPESPQPGDAASSVGLAQLAALPASLSSALINAGVMNAMAAGGVVGGTGVSVSNHGHGQLAGGGGRPLLSLAAAGGGGATTPATSGHAGVAADSAVVASIPQHMLQLAMSGGGQTQMLQMLPVSAVAAATGLSDATIAAAVAGTAGGTPSAS